VSSDVKAKVIARVTGIPFIPKKTVEIAENQVVVEKPLCEAGCPYCHHPKSYHGGSLGCIEEMDSHGYSRCGCKQYFAIGGIVENTEPVTISATVTDHVLPHAVVQKFEALADTEKQLQAAQTQTDAEDGNFLIDFSQTLSAELDSVLEPDTRALHFPADAPSREEIDAAFVGIGAPDSSEISEQDEHLAEHMARVRSTPEPSGEPVVHGMQTVQVSGPTDYEMAAELGLSVHAYRWIKRELEAVRGHNTR
jgi:hypothetical protein